MVENDILSCKLGGSRSIAEHTGKRVEAEGGGGSGPALYMSWRSCALRRYNGIYEAVEPVCSATTGNKARISAGMAMGRPVVRST
jgi:hypothetical protein